MWKIFFEKTFNYAELNILNAYLNIKLICCEGDFIFLTHDKLINPFMIWSCWFNRLLNMIIQDDNKILEN